MSETEDRIEQMLRVLPVLEEKGLSVKDALDVLRAFYVNPVDLEPTFVLDTGVEKLSRRPTPGSSANSS